MIRLVEQAFRLTHVSRHGTLQAVGFLPDGRWYSIVQSPENLRGDRQITYEIMVEGQEPLKWLAAEDFDTLVAEWLSEPDNSTPRDETAV